MILAEEEVFVEFEEVWPFVFSFFDEEDDESEVVSAESSDDFDESIDDFDENLSFFGGVFFFEWIVSEYIVSEDFVPDFVSEDGFPDVTGVFISVLLEVTLWFESEVDFDSESSDDFDESIDDFDGDLSVVGVAFVFEVFVSEDVVSEDDFPDDFPDVSLDVDFPDVGILVKGKGEMIGFLGFEVLSPSFFLVWVFSVSFSIGEIPISSILVGLLIGEVDLCIIFPFIFFVLFNLDGFFPFNNLLMIK